MNFVLRTNTNTDTSPAPFSLYSIPELNMRRGLKIYAPISAVLLELSLYGTINRADFSYKLALEDSSSNRSAVSCCVCITHLLIIHSIGAPLRRYFSISRRRKILTSSDNSALFFLSFLQTHISLQICVREFATHEKRHTAWE